MLLLNIKAGYPAFMFSGHQEEIFFFLQLNNEVS
jgi:hypothetical protein